MTARKVGPWRVNAEHTAFDNPWIRIVHHDVTQPDGSPGQYGVVKFKNLAIGVLPIDTYGHVPLVGQHRFPNDYYSWELPEGGGSLEASPLESAKRELKEETGMSASEWRKLAAFDISNSVTDERAVCYLAWELSEGAADPDPTEELTLKRVHFREMFEMVMAGEIIDSLTIVMTLTAHAKALRGELPASISRHILAGAAGK